MMNKEKLSICLRLIKAGHITEDEFTMLMQTEKEYVSTPAYPSPTVPKYPYITWSKVDSNTGFIASETQVKVL